ncbi:hypothetical protein AX17_003571 [Amanita inopinata Kibby_2008]|nr:hypothetical protein AX17_003571 [Amanita inopinata Kibby_2008]
MTASGPFAMGPAMNNTKHSSSRINFAPPASQASSSTTSRVTVDHTTVSSFKKEESSISNPVKQGKDEDDEVYSEPDEGVEIIDIQRVRELDWMAPETLRKAPKPLEQVKKEDIDTANAIDLGESDEDVENLAPAGLYFDSSLREDKLFLFQFPSPFPTFLPSTECVTPSLTESKPSSPAKKTVTFTPDVKLGPNPDSASVPTGNDTSAPTAVDGVIGQVEVYRSGTVKLRLMNGILLDVNVGTQPAFLQQAVCINRIEKQLTVLGEMNVKFIISPDVDTLLHAMDEEDRHSGPFIDGEDTLIKMDPMDTS